MSDTFQSLLRDHQKEPARHLGMVLASQGDGYPGAVDLSDVGVGKTYMDLAAALTTGRKVGVLCPVVGVDGWNDAFRHFGAEPAFITSYDAVRGGFRSEIATVSGGQFHWKRPQDLTLILDECQAVKNPDSLSARCVDGAIAASIPIICASATLATSPLELRIAGQLTGLHQGGSDWDRFMVEHGCWYDADDQRWKWKRNTYLLDSLHRQLIPNHGIRVRKSDMGDQPGSTLRLLPFEIPEGPQIEKEWREALAILERLQGQRMSHLQAANIRRGVRTRLWKRCELALVDVVAEAVRQDVRDGKSAVVFFSFTESRLAMGRLLRTNAGFYGGQNAKLRSYWQREFQANRQHILLNNITAGGSSVSLHDTTGDRPRVSYIFPTDKAVAMGQAPGRIDRSGGKTHSMQWIPYVAGTLSERMVRATSRKLFQMARINDGAPQVKPVLNS